LSTPFLYMYQPHRHHHLQTQRTTKHRTQASYLPTYKPNLHTPCRLQPTAYSLQPTSLQGACLVNHPQNFHFHFTSSKNIKSKTFLLFYTFYITSIIFYYYPNKKTHYKTKLFHFSIKYSQIFYHINHFLLLFK
jgi:hypothetical protein